MQKLEFIRQHKYPIIIASILVALAFLWSFMNSYSGKVTDSAWDGVVATSFTSGTGTEANPYVISNAGEYAYLKEVLEGSNAALYADKKYVITGGFNYGEFEISINNSVPFSGIIDGQGNLIYNATIFNNLFNELDGATIKNINFADINYELNVQSGAIFAKTITDSEVSLVAFSGSVNADSNAIFGGFIYNSSGNSYDRIILNYDIVTPGVENYKFAYSLEEDKGSNILVKSDDYENTKEETDIVFGGFTSINSVDFSSFADERYQVIVSNDKLVIKDLNEPEEEEPEKESGSKAPSRGGAKAATRGVVGSDTITEHASGASGNTFYINDLVADKNYMKGLNFAEIRSTSIPSGISTGYYDDSNLVKVEIIYDGQDINTSSLVGALSPLNNENTNKFIYFKYYALERNSNGSLATNSEGNNYIKIELIDNPYSKRPYTTSGGNTIEYGFNGWVCNQNVDTTSNLCAYSKFSIRKSDYTRYLEVPVNGGSEIVIHLNVSWYRANVSTSYNNFSNSFSNYSMQPTYYTQNEYVTHYGKGMWRQNYAQMIFLRTYVRGDNEDGYMPANTWYKTNQNGTSYRYNSSRTRCSRNTTCYTYTADPAAIAADTEYTGGSVTFVPNFSSNGTNNETTINNFNWTYMYIQDDPSGPYTHSGNEDVPYSYLSSGANVTGFYYQVNNPTSAMINTGEYYDANGVLCTSTSSCSTAYKLIHYDDATLNSNGNSIATTETVNGKIADLNKYYYLVTRDMNIFRYTYTGNSGNDNNTNGLSMSYLSSINKPFTVTGTALNATTARGILSTYSSNLTAGNDIVIENIRIYGPGSAGNNNITLGNNTRNSYSFYANGHNLKLGRNLVSSRTSTYLIAYSVMGGTNSAGPSGTFRVIVESGFYQAYHSGAMSGSSNYTLNETTIIGNDYDRIRTDNSKLRFLVGVDGYAGGHHTAGSDSLFASFNIVKSGQLGYNSNGTANTDNTAGMYIGGRSSTCVNSITGAKVEGGQINTIVGGYGYNGSTDTNSTYIGMSGGTVRSIYGGAGHSTTKGNRIISVTGGTVSYSVLGGSDSYSSTETDDGVVQGSTLVYVGGNVTVGGGSGELNGVEAGSVFGAGGGNSNPNATSKGTVYNSHVIINGGTINSSVYGGGNFGSTGTQHSATSNTVIDIYAGTIGSVYGGSKSAGFGKSNYENNSLIDINVTGGTIGNLYGGSNTKGTIYGSVDIDITGGTVTGSVYGGGQGSPTVVTNNVEVTIGDSNGGPTINHNVYGGSAMGTVNSASKGSVVVTVNDGTIRGSVFGGGEGDATTNPVTEPSVLGTITVNIEGGDITSVFGGNDQAGSHTKTNTVNLDGGIVGTAYGGGNKSSVTTTNVILDGCSVTTIYGGSNTSGDVTTANVTITSGSVGTIYGGNNAGGTCGTTYVEIEGTATISGNVYGGGNAVATTTTNVTLTSAGSSIGEVYGGGHSASAGTTHVTHEGITVTSIFGGSNTSGTVTNSYVSQEGGNVTTIYGGNNAGGNTITSHVDITGGGTNQTVVYGGGSRANGGTSNVTMSAGTVNKIFGGGNNAGLDESNVTVTGGTVNEIFGGSDNTGVVDETNVSYNYSSGTPSVIYGGGNLAAVGDTNVTFNSGTVGAIFGGGKSAAASGDTLVDINGGTISTNVFGGGDDGAVSGTSTVFITDATILGNAYAAGNGSTAVVAGDATITIDGSTTVGSANTSAPNAGCVFGGGNEANTGSQGNEATTTVNILGGTFYGNVYGGAKFAVIYGDTVVNIGQSAYTSQTLDKDDIDIKGHIFGGGEANSSGSSDIFDWSFVSVTDGVTITIDGDTYTNFNIDGSFYGGGNASKANGDSYLVIRNYGVTGSPEENISIQRVTYVTIENSSILLRGAIDRANEYDREKFAISRVERLKIKDNSEIYFVSGCNLLEEFVSVDENDQKATVTINETTHTITNINVDNRIYIYEGKNVNISHDQQTEDCGDVSGMTFLGLFNFDGDNVNTGIYNPTYDAGVVLPATGLFAKGSYVLGKHLTSHNIKIDGFYTHHRNSTDFKNEIQYVDPTPPDSPFYKWFVGQNAISYTVNLVASKYSTMGAVEAPFHDFSAPNTSFEILTLDSSELAQGVSLVDRANIPRVAATSADANSIYGLSMEASNSGWLTTGKTSFYTSSPTIRGVRHYEGENSTVAPTMLFYLYHSKNISEELDLGKVSITVQAETKLSAIASEISLLVINVNMTTALFSTNEYEGAMTPGDKYELFMSTSTNISSKSKYSAYYSLYGAGQNLYQTGYHRVLTSTFVFPENTKITMLDFINGVPEYYYHVMTASDVAAAESDYQANNNTICSYPLSIFTTMGSVNSNSNYSDATKNAIYYDGTDSSEEFIFIVDFSDANISSDKLNQKLLIEMRNSQEEDMISVLGAQHQLLTYNVYTGKDSHIDIDVDTSLNPLYIGYNDVFDVTINYQNSNLSGVSIIDTQYFDSKMGVQIYITNADGHVVSGTDLTGTYFLMDDQRYYPDISGYTHIKLADKVGNTEKWIVFNTENSGLATGTYTFNFEAFASPDGIYYSSGTPDYYQENINIINSTYGLDPVIDENSIIYSSANDKTFNFTINYTSLLNSPNIRVQMFRRKYDTVYDTNYQTFDFQNFLAYQLPQSTSNQYEYIIDNNPIRTRSFTFPVQSTLTTGTYRLAFRLYDGDTMIGEIYRYIIVK